MGYIIGLTHKVKIWYFNNFWWWISLVSYKDRCDVTVKSSSDLVLDSENYIYLTSFNWESLFRWKVGWQMLWKKGFIQQQQDGTDMKRAASPGDRGCVGRPTPRTNWKGRFHQHPGTCIVFPRRIQSKTETASPAGERPTPPRPRYLHVQRLFQDPRLGGVN